MIKKLIKIQNIGKFQSCCAAGDVQFRKTTLFYAENGRGKTTLCDIFSSLQSGVGSFITGRATLGSGIEPAVEILLDGSKVTFKNGTWSAIYPNIVVYDSKFVYENVYAGDYVAHEHKKNLYKVIVGEEGVVLAKKVDELDEKIRRANKNLSEKQLSVRQSVPPGISFEVFIALEKDEEVDQKITDQQKIIASLRIVTQIFDKPTLTKIFLPTFPSGFQGLLKKSLEDVSEEAEEIIRAHMETHMREPRETWLSEGLGLLVDETCPFCSQSLHGNALFGAYKTHFETNYKKLKADVDSMKASLTSFATEVDFLRLEKTILQNQSLCEYWTQFVTIDSPSIDVTLFRTLLEELRSIALRYADNKVAHPLDAIKPGKDFTAAIEGYRLAQILIDDYNTVVESANKLIEAKKDEAKTGDLSKAERELKQLQASKIRHEQNVIKAYEDFRKAFAKKKGLEVEKQMAKNTLEEYSGTVFQRYQGRINKLLEMFGASFRIENTRGRYTGGTPSSTYHLVINAEQVELGDANTPLNKPSFKNTLSAGDKSTLALAFFLVQLKQSPSLAQKVVIFDDPFTSQDRSRRTCTQQEICRLSRETTQVLLLSHDPYFLKLVWDELPSAEVKVLQLARMGPNTTITECDIKDQVRGDYFQNHTNLRKYRDYGEGDPRHVAKTIRPLLEGYLRFKLPGYFGDNDWLGDFIKSIREADQTNPIAVAQVILEELEDLNNYSKRYHHDQNPSANAEPISEVELEVFVKRTLKLVGGF